jgi:hypothetical protein
VYEGSGYITFRDRTLLAWWRLDEGAGTNLNDSSLYKRTGTTYNTPTWVSGNNAIRYGSPYSLEFDGFTQYAQASADGLANRAMTILLWAKPKSLPNEVNVSHFLRDMVGSILWVGQAVLVLGGKYSGLGSLLVGGFADCFNSNDVEPGGKLVFTGLARQTVTVFIQSLGGFVIGGLATVIEAINAIDMIGQLILSGNADTNTTALIEALGKLTFNGISSTKTTALVNGAGGILVSGRSVNKTSGIFSPAGLLTFNGLATASYAMNSAGGFVFSGTANLTATYTVNALGKLTFNGVATAGSQSVYFMVPNADVVLGNWTDQNFGTTNIYQAID